jgi:hypothetical protein
LSQVEGVICDKTTAEINSQLTSALTIQTICSNTRYEQLMMICQRAMRAFGISGPIMN